MSVATSFDGAARGIASAASGQVVASYPTYEQAQRAVDHLSDSGFPVEQSAIVGSDLRLVEQVVGRLTKTRATLMGAASGAWFGLFVGLLVTLFVIGPEWIAVTLTAASSAPSGGRSSASLAIGRRMVSATSPRQAPSSRTGTTSP